MDKARLPVFAELSLGDTKDPASKPACKLTFSKNPRQLRVIHALLAGPLTREQLDRVAGSSNGPALIAELRDSGLGKEGLPCTLIPDRDRDGVLIRRGVYHLSTLGRSAVYEWLRLRGQDVEQGMHTISQDGIYHDR